MRGRHGISLAELIVCCSIFMTLIVALMATYITGVRTYQLMVSRQGIQSEIRRIQALLRRDVTLTDYRSVGVEDRVAAVGTGERDALNFVGVDAWTDRANFDQYLKPRWNIYVMYYATCGISDRVGGGGDRELGQFIRKELVQDVPYPVPLLPSFTKTYLDTPSTGDSYKLLSSAVQSFEVNISQVDENIQAHVVLRSERGATGSGRLRESEIIECYIDMRPENTWPPK